MPVDIFSLLDEAERRYQGGLQRLQNQALEPAAALPPPQQDRPADAGNDEPEAEAPEGDLQHGRTAGDPLDIAGHHGAELPGVAVVDPGGYMATAVSQVPPPHMTPGEATTQTPRSFDTGGADVEIPARSPESQSVEVGAPAGVPDDGLPTGQAPAGTVGLPAEQARATLEPLPQLSVAEMAELSLSAVTLPGRPGTDAPQEKVAHTEMSLRDELLTQRHNFAPTALELPHAETWAPAGPAVQHATGYEESRFTPATGDVDWSDELWQVDGPPHPTFPQVYDLIDDAFYLNDRRVD